MADVVASTDALNSRVGRGVAWSALNSSVLRVGQFFIAIVTARLVSPAEFGVFVVALTVFSIVVNVSEVGVSAAIIREPDRTRQIAPTVSTIAIVTSALLAVMMAIAAPALAHALARMHREDGLVSGS
ncbi:MAG TPA: oligosaccharide flippase family protein [Solirubrobacteraceae bacterium]|nr:oligosaccharide flippase family protein [Solirubrobacteraceae bacterium]